MEGNWNTVFILDEPPSEIDITQNIVVVDNEQTHAIFSEGFNGGINDVNTADNCYWNADSGNINLGLPSWGDGEIESNPMFTDYEGQQYSLQSNSPAANAVEWVVTSLGQYAILDRVIKHGSRPLYVQSITRSLMNYEHYFVNRLYLRI